jgi:hypothetical protein
MSAALVALLVAGSVAPSWLTIAASDGQPPVTIIEIPIPPTTVVESSTIPASSDRPASTTGVVEPAPPSGDLFDLDISEADPVLNLGGSPWPWPAKVGLGLALGGLAFLSLVLVLRAFNGTPRSRDPRSNAADRSPIAAAIAAASSRFEAVEYQTGTAFTDSAVRARTIGEFSSLQEAIDAARLARSQYNPQAPDPDAWWVVWNLNSKRASWIAEWDTPGESIIDLRSGRREPYVAQEALDHHHDDA